MDPQHAGTAAAEDVLLIGEGYFRSSSGRFPPTLLKITGAAALCAALLTIGATILQWKHYMRPTLQRHVVRIFLLVPIFAAASWASLYSAILGEFLVPIRDIYEAFTIYTFFKLLIGYMGGEIALLKSTYGRPPVPHLWPFNYFFHKIDVSDPQVFLAIKRGILQYVWVKPVLAFLTIIMKLTGTFQEGYMGLSSGYLWISIVYNVSISISLYALSLFWVCMSEKLQPYRPMPKFLCVKGIVFASYWQGMLLSILVMLGLFPDSVSGYSPETLAAAIQDAILCVEMPFFALLHWYAFGWRDYMTPPEHFCRFVLKSAIRDSLGTRDIVHDTIQTWKGRGYNYWEVDTDGLPHDGSRTLGKQLRAGIRYYGTERVYLSGDGGVGTSSPLLRRGSTSSNANGRESSGSGYGTIDDDSEPEFDRSEEIERLYSEAMKIDVREIKYPAVPIIPEEPYKRRHRSTEAGLRSSQSVAVKPIKTRRRVIDLSAGGSSSSSSSPKKKPGKQTREHYQGSQGPSTRPSSQSIRNIYRSQQPPQNPHFFGSSLSNELNFDPNSDHLEAEDQRIPRPVDPMLPVLPDRNPWLDD